MTTVFLNTRLPKVLIVSTTPDALNLNRRIRHYVFLGFKEALDENAVLSVSIDFAEEAILQFRPTLIVAIGSLALDIAPLYKIKYFARRARSRVAFWLHDDPYEFDYTDKITDFADHIFTNDRWAVPHYHNIPATHLPLAACKQHYYREIKSFRTRVVDLFFCGVAFENRIDLFEKIKTSMMTHKVEVFGSNWPTSLLFATNKRLSSSQIANKYNSARIVLNIGRDLDIANKRYRLPSSSPGPRVFEAAMAGAPQISFVNSLEILDYFDSQTEIILFDNYNEIKETILESYRSAATFEKIAKRAQRKVLEHHTYFHRAKRILSIMAQ